LNIITYKDIPSSIFRTLYSQTIKKEMSDEKNENINNNPETRNSIDHEQETIIFKREAKNFDTFTETYKKYKNANSIKTVFSADKASSSDIASSSDSDTASQNSKSIKNEKSKPLSSDNYEYYIAICQNGDYIAIFNTGEFTISYLLLHKLYNYNI
jgi:hypothetical protein